MQAVDVKVRWAFGVGAGWKPVCDPQRQLKQVSARFWFGVPPLGGSVCTRFEQCSYENRLKAELRTKSVRNTGGRFPTFPTCATRCAPASRVSSILRPRIVAGSLCAF